MPPVERVVYEGNGLEIGAFRCPRERRDFRHAGPIGDHCTFAFPRTAVRIRPQGAPAFAADARTVTFYNPRQPYEREALDPAGDCSDWFALEATEALEIARAADPRGSAREGAPFRFTHGPSDAATYLRQRELFTALARGRALDPLTVEEALFGLLASVLRLAAGARGARPPAVAALTGTERRAVAAVRDLLAHDFRRPLTLSHLARTVGLSRFRLCRAFRAATGSTLHAHRDQLRLRASLGPLGEGCRDLTGLALDLGYSSHSHFSERFRHAFGMTPSQARARL
jgi:AraC family transcriptional regulator